MSITQPVWVSVCVCARARVFAALVIRHATRMRHIVICGLPRSTIFPPHFLISGTIFRGGKKVTQHEMYGLTFSSVTILILRSNERDMITAACRSSSAIYFRPVLLKHEFPRQIF